MPCRVRMYAAFTPVFSHYRKQRLYLENGGDIVDTASIPDMHFHSDWAIANPTVRDKVLSSRMVIIYTHETVTL